MSAKESFRKVLIVDDEPEVVEFLRNFLKRRSVEVHLAYQGLEALAIFEKESPDLVLLDIGIPNLDGLGVLRRIKEKSPKTKVVMITAKNDSTSVTEAKKIGADAYITKPVDLAELHSLIDKYLK